MKNLIIVIMIAVFSTGICLADDPVQPQDLLKWLPDSGYSRVSYSNAKEINESKIQKQYRYLFGYVENGSLDQSLLPKSMKGALVANCNATLFTIKMVEKKQNSRAEHQNRGPSQKLINTGESFSILYLSDADALVKKSAKKGLFRRAGFKLFKQPVFSLSSGSDKEREEGFLWLSPDGYLILTKTKDTMKLVAKTGMGLNPSFLEKSDNSRIKNMANELGPEWTVRFVSADKQEKIDVLLDEGADYERVEALEKSLEEEMVYEVVSFKLAEEITKTKYMVFPDAETAEKKKKEYKKGIKEAGIELGKDLAEEKSEKSGKKLDRLDKAVNTFVTLVLTDVRDTLDTQKITVDGDTVISMNTFGEDQYQMRIKRKDAKKTMDERVKIIVARHKAEHGEQ